MITKETEEEILKNKENWSLVLAAPGMFQYHYSTDKEIFRIIVYTGLVDEIKIIKKGDKKWKN